MRTQTQQQRIVAILSRDLGPGQIKGARPRTVSSILAGLSKAGEVFQVRQFNALEIRTPTALIDLAVTVFRSWLSGKSIPLQCALYAIRSEQKRVLTAIHAISPTVIYIDMIRLAPIIPILRREFPSARLVLDMDDLISRRFELIGNSHASISLGYIDSLLPSKLSNFLKLQSISRWLAYYEARTMRRVELDAVRSCDAAVLVSEVEVKILAERLGEDCADKDKLNTILPPVDIVTPSVGNVVQPVSFVFIGTDRLLQNALTIDWLLETWEHTKPTTTLSIVGQQIRPKRNVQGVRWLGFVDDLTSIFDEKSVVLAPSFIGGGVKTKILEAFAFGRPAIGNTTSFEGIEIAGYPLNLDEGEIRKLVSHPGEYLQQMTAAAMAGWRYVNENATPSRHQEEWSRLAVSR